MHCPVSLSSNWHPYTFIIVSWQQSRDTLSGMLTICILPAGRPLWRVLPKWMISAPTMSDLNTKSLFSLHGESIIHVIILSKNHFYFFFLDRFFFGVYHTISPQNVIIPCLFILHRTNLTYQFCFISWADGWGGFFQPAGSMWQI